MSDCEREHSPACAGAHPHWRLRPRTASERPSGVALSGLQLGEVPSRKSFIRAPIARALRACLSRSPMVLALSPTNEPMRLTWLHGLMTRSHSID